LSAHQACANSLLPSCVSSCLQVVFPTIEAGGCIRRHELIDLLLDTVILPPEELADVADSCVAAPWASRWPLSTWERLAIAAIKALPRCGQMVRAATSACMRASPRRAPR
jgi:hypothetical protein